LYRISFTAIGVLADDDVVFALELDFGARVLADEYLVAGLDRERVRAATVEDLAVADGDDHRLKRLLLGGVGNEQATGGLLILRDAGGQDAIVEWADPHFTSVSSFDVAVVGNPLVGR
jgi:hypothetical protein